MQIAPIPKNEPGRIAALYRYNILDSLPEKEYDDIVKLASAICETPIALISLVDHDRQWFKARVGLDAEGTSRRVSFCAHSILEPLQPLIISDATRDDRFHDNDLVTSGPQIRFYAGFPLNTPDGHSLGTLCAIDTKPRQLTEKQAETLSILAKNVVNLLELRKANADNKKLIAELAGSNESLENFAYICSHDLQQPLRKINNCSKQLREHLTEQIRDDQTGQAYFDMVDESVVQAQTLITDILEYSGIEHADQEPEAVNLDTLLKELLSNHRKDYQESGAEIQISSLPTITGNKTQLGQLFLNLISNGIKYQAAGNKPMIQIGYEEKESHWQFFVKDNGIGIQERYYSRIFKTFQRLHTYKEYTGSGIGLSICKKIVEFHSGDIWLESNFGKGTCFYFTIAKNN